MEVILFSEKESFDIVLMTHPDSIGKLPGECKKVVNDRIAVDQQDFFLQIPHDYDPKSPGPGQCIYRELVPISERNHK